MLKTLSPLTFEAVQAALVEAVRMARRLPGGGRWPFASDGPWHLITRKARVDGSAMDAWRQEQDAVAEGRNVTRTVPLTAEEVSEMERRLGWLVHAPEQDRKLVAVVLQQLSGREASRVRWSDVRAVLSASPAWRAVAVSNRGLGQRYSRAMAAIVRALDALGERL